MSINSAMLAGVSGLVANSSALAAISDNIANVNTVGYKRNELSFSNVVTAQSTSGRYSAGGVQGQPAQYISQQGLLQSTASSTDIAVAGDGLFVVSEGASGPTADSRLFTRAGQFQVDADGYLRNTGGYYLQGWLVDALGNVNANPSDLSLLSAINVKNVGAAVRPSTEVQLTANLNSQQTLSPDLGAYDAVTNSMSAYDPVGGTGTKPDFTIQMNIIDSQGGAHTVAISFLKTANANEWNAEIYAVPASDVTSGAGLAAGQIASGLVTFTQDGKLDTDPLATTLFADPANPSITLGASDAGAPGAGAVNWAANLGISGQSLALELGSSAEGGLTQLAKASSVTTVGTNGAGVGQIVGVEVSEDGYVTAIFDNGEVRRLAQIALATFPNPNGLRALSGNAFGASIEAGDYSLKRPGEGGAGDVAGSALEASTVDLSSEFAGLITTQRAYSASSKIILTADQMMEELLNIKR
jgi:flagellar hook protein FlgE